MEDFDWNQAARDGVSTALGFFTGSRNKPAPAPAPAAQKKPNWIPWAIGIGAALLVGALLLKRGK